MINNSKTYHGRDLEAMSFATNYHQLIVDEFRPFLGQRIAEVGGGMGNFSEFLLACDISELVTFEPSENMFPVLERNLSRYNNVHLKKDYFENHSDEYIQQFDSVCYVNVLEHIENDREALIQAHRTLREKGHLLIFVPALQFLYSKFDSLIGHYRRYTKPGLVDLVNSAGYSIVKARYFDSVGILPWYLAYVVCKMTTGSRYFFLYDKIVVPVVGFIERKITPPIGKNILLIAEKN